MKIGSEKNSSVYQNIIGKTTQYLEEIYMVDFIVNLFAAIADFFITFWVDNVMDKFAKRNK